MKYLNLEDVEPLKVDKIQCAPSGRAFLFECDGVCYEFLKSSISHYRLVMHVGNKIVPHVFVFNLLSNTILEFECIYNLKNNRTLRANKFLKRHEEQLKVLAKTFLVNIVGTYLA